MTFPPYLIGGLAMLFGYMKSMLRRSEQYPDEEFIKFVRQYQRKALIMGKLRAIEVINGNQLAVWNQQHLNKQ